MGRSADSYDTDTSSTANGQLDAFSQSVQRISRYPPTDTVSGSTAVFVSARGVVEPAPAGFSSSVVNAAASTAFQSPGDATDTSSFVTRYSNGIVFTPDLKSSCFAVKVTETDARAVSCAFRKASPKTNPRLPLANDPSA